MFLVLVKLNLFVPAEVDGVDEVVGGGNVGAGVVTTYVVLQIISPLNDKETKFGGSVVYGNTN